MKLSELYFPYETKVSEILLQEILLKFRECKKISYHDLEEDEDHDEFLELISITPDFINFRRRNGVKWDLKMELLKEAIKYTLRYGRILKSGQYNKITGTSNLRGTPLRLVISLLEEAEYSRYSLVNRILPHFKFNDYIVLGIDLPNQSVSDAIIYIRKNDEPYKKIKMSRWEINEDEFRAITS